MNKNFEYLYTLQAQDSLEIEDIGNVCIHVLNDLGFEWYMIIHTELGDTQFKILGPFHVDLIDNFSHGFKYEYYHMDYRESHICNKIDAFINDNKKLITQAIVCDPEEAYEKLTAINFREMR